MDKIQLDLQIIADKLITLQVRSTDLPPQTSLKLLGYINDEKFLTEMIIDSRYEGKVHLIKNRLKELSKD